MTSLIYLLTLLFSSLLNSSISTLTPNSFEFLNSSKFISPNLYFVGFSKCGTSSLSQLLIEHPLIVDVGGPNSKMNESHIFDLHPLERANVIQTEWLKKRLKKKIYAQQILDHGIIMHYTPNYAGEDNIEDKIIQTLEENGKTVNDAKFLFMLRNPTSRTGSSWWFKNFCHLHPNDCPSFSSQIDRGIVATRKMFSCYKRHNLTLDELVNALRDGRHDLTEAQLEVLDLCPITLMSPWNTPFYNAHIFGNLSL